VILLRCRVAARAGQAGGADGGVSQHAQDGQALRRWREQPRPLRPLVHAGVADHHGGRGELLPLPFAASDWVGMGLPPRLLFRSVLAQLGWE